MLYREKKEERDLTPLVWTLFILLVVIGGGGGSLLIRNLHRCDLERSKAVEDLKTERTKYEAERAANEQCTQQLNTAKTDLEAANKALEEAKEEASTPGRRR